MQYTFDWRTQHAVDVTPGSYFSSVMMADDKVVESTAGHDEFELNGMILPEKRLAGLGRQQQYHLQDMPAGLSALEARPSQPVEISPETSISFAIDTNIFLSQGLLSHYLSLGVQKNGEFREIPLQSPEVEIDWQSRGKYIVSVKSL